MKHIYEEVSQLGMKTCPLWKVPFPGLRSQTVENEEKTAEQQHS